MRNAPLAELVADPLADHLEAVEVAFSEVTLEGELSQQGLGHGERVEGVG